MEKEHSRKGSAGERELSGKCLCKQGPEFRFQEPMEKAAHSATCLLPRARRYDSVLGAQRTA